MDKKKKKYDRLKPVNVVTTAAIVATTLFTPIVDVLPGQHNVALAEEGQNNTTTKSKENLNYFMSNASNGWSGFRVASAYPQGNSEIPYENYKRFHNSISTGTLVTDDKKAATREIKMRVNNANWQIIFGDLHFIFDKKDAYEEGWRLNGPIVPMSNEVPRRGEWAIWKYAYDNVTNKTTYYLNGKKIHERSGRPAYEHFGCGAYQGGGGYIDIEYAGRSDSNTVFLFPPKVNEVTDAQTKVTGSVNLNPGVTVTVESNEMPGKYEGTADENGNFSIDIPKQKGGAQLTVTQTSDGVTSEKTVVTVKDATAPEAPKVNNVTETDKKVTGTGEPGAKAIVKIGSGKFEGTVDEKGNYAVDILEQTVGTEISVSLTDTAGNTSQPTKTKVEAKDVTAPDAPKVNTVTDQDTKVTGTGEKLADVSVVVDGKEIGKGKVDDQGNFTVDIPKQPGGKEVVVTLKDAAGNTSQPTKTKVETKDVTAPDAPKVNTVTDQDTKVTGTGEKGAKVSVVVDGKEIGTGKVDDQGKYTVDIPKQPGGKEVVVTLKDAAGNTVNLLKQK